MSTVNSNIQSPVGQRRDSSNVLFPWILRVFDLKAVDFFKVLDSFVHAESHLAPEIIKVCLVIYTRVTKLINAMLIPLTWKCLSISQSKITY